MGDFINRFSEHVQKELNLNDDRRDVLVFGLTTLISTIGSYAAIIAVGLLAGAVKLALIAAVTSTLFRVVSGGAHSRCMRNCIILGAIVSPGIAVISKWAGPGMPVSTLYLLVAVTWLFSLAAILRYAPADTPNRPIVKPEERRKFRGMSLTVLAVWGITAINAVMFKLTTGEMILASALGLLWQTHSITPHGYRLVEKFDQLI